MFPEKMFLKTIVLGTLLILPVSARADNSQRTDTSSRTPMVEDKDGNLASNEFEVISTNNSITRALCPYSCEMRGLPKKFCKTWQSKQDPSMCYVQDTRIPSDAISLK